MVSTAQKKSTNCMKIRTIWGPSGWSAHLPGFRTNASSWRGLIRRVPTKAPNPPVFFNVAADIRWYQNSKVLQFTHVSKAIWSLKCSILEIYSIHHVPQFRPYNFLNFPLYVVDTVDGFRNPAITSWGQVVYPIIYKVYITLPGGEIIPSSPPPAPGKSWLRSSRDDRSLDFQRKWCWPTCQPYNHYHLLGSVKIGKDFGCKYCFLESLAGVVFFLRERWRREEFFLGVKGGFRWCQSGVKKNGGSLWGHFGFRCSCMEQPL